MQVSRDYAHLMFRDVLLPYRVIKSSSLELDVLAFFLADIGSFAYDLRDWTLNASDGATSTNAHWLSKYDSIVTLGDIFDKEDTLVFDYSLKQIVGILDQWEDLYKKQVKEIWIYKEGDKIWLEGKN